jgi:hypothetical protein
MRTRAELLDLIPKDRNGYCPNARMREIALMLLNLTIPDGDLVFFEKEILHQSRLVSAAMLKREAWLKSVAFKYL